MGIFSKGAQTRINETIDLILQDVQIPERTAVGDYIRAELDRMGGGDVAALSKPMSMNDLEERGTAEERKKRRALILMSYCKANNLTLEGVKHMAVGNLTGEYFASIGRLRLLANQEKGLGNLIRDKYNEMIANPDTFLRANMLFTVGSNTDGEMDQFFFYEFKNGVAGYKISSSLDPHPPRAYLVRVISVPGVVWRDVPNRGDQSANGSFADVHGTELAGASLMVTTQFSGCSFCFKEVTATQRRFAAHIMPGLQHIQGSDIAGGGNELANQLAGDRAPAVTAGNFSAPGNGAGDFRVFGSGYSNIPGHGAGYDSSQSLTIIGVLRLGAWSFYSQLSVNRVVRSAAQIL
jgi:hypothetical protein